MTYEFLLYSLIVSKNSKLSFRIKTERLFLKTIYWYTDGVSYGSRKPLAQAKRSGVDAGASPILRALLEDRRVARFLQRDHNVTRYPYLLEKYLKT